MMAYIYYNQRVLDRHNAARTQRAAGASLEEWLRYVDQLPPITYDELGRAVFDDGAGGSGAVTGGSGSSGGAGGAGAECIDVT